MVSIQNVRGGRWCASETNWFHDLEVAITYKMQDSSNRGDKALT